MFAQRIKPEVPIIVEPVFWENVLEKCKTLVDSIKALIKHTASRVLEYKAFFVCLQHFLCIFVKGANNSGAHCPDH